MITNRLEVFVKFITIFAVVVFMPTPALADSQLKFQDSSQLFNKYRQDSKHVLQNLKWGKKKKSQKENNSKHVENSYPGNQKNLWSRWKTKNNQHISEQTNSNQKKTGNHRNHDTPDSNKHNGIKQRKQKPEHVDHKHHNRRNNTQRHNYDGFDRREQNSHNKNQHKLPRSKHERHPSKPEKHVAVNHRHKHRPKHHLYNRHKHIYYRTPWYNTRYIAPIHYHYHPIGHRVRYLPELHVRVFVGGFSYFYFGGVFYQSIGSSYIVVGAPIGSLIQTLPIGFIGFSIGPSTFYYVNDTYYVWDIFRQGYLVIEKPTGADNAIEEATTGRLFAYPKREQSEEQQAKDRYECHRWAVIESGVDPSLEDVKFSTVEKLDYQRAMGACLEGRDYAVK